MLSLLPLCQGCHHPPHLVHQHRRWQSNEYGMLWLDWKENAAAGFVKGHAHSFISAQDVTGDGCLWRVMQFRNPCPMPHDAACKNVSRALREIHAFVALSVICFASLCIAPFASLAVALLLLASCVIPQWRSVCLIFQFNCSANVMCSPSCGAHL